MCTCLHGRAGAGEGIRHPGGEATDNCELLDMSAGSWTLEEQQVLLPGEPHFHEF